MPISNCCTTDGSAFWSHMLRVCSVTAPADHVDQDRDYDPLSPWQRESRIESGTLQLSPARDAVLVHSRCMPYIKILSLPASLKQDT